MRRRLPGRDRAPCEPGINPHNLGRFVCIGSVRDELRYPFYHSARTLPPKSETSPPKRETKNVAPRAAAVDRRQRSARRRFRPRGGVVAPPAQNLSGWVQAQTGNVDTLCAAGNVGGKTPIRNPTTSQGSVPSPPGRATGSLERLLGASSFLCDSPRCAWPTALIGLVSWASCPAR